MRRRFVTLDVFTATRFAGNPLAVVLESEGLDTGAMLAITREFNLSETVFVFPPSAPSSRARLRIFTPGRELPFAGHPTVGTAVLLSILDGSSASEIVLEETIGPIRCRVEPKTAEAGHAEFELPRLPAHEPGASDRAAMAAALGLTAGDIGLDDWPVERWSAGNPFTFVPLRGLDAMRRCRVDLAGFDAAFPSSAAPAAFLFCRESGGADVDFHARMFAPAMGVIEDPATGSAAAAFAGYLAARQSYRDGEHLIHIEQGIEMGRPSLIALRMQLGGASLTSAAIGGSAVVTCDGTLLT